jgi:hypothetical protein
VTSYAIPPIQGLENLRKQLNAIFADIFGAANAFTAVQTFPVGGIVIGTVKILGGSGSPESAVAAPVASLYLRTDGGASTSLYVKESGTGDTGWVAK